MYFFYLDESGARDPSIGTAEKPKEHLYVLLAVGLYERQWRPFEAEIPQVKLELAAGLQEEGQGVFGLADCEVKSNWLRIPRHRSRFLSALASSDLQRLTEVYFGQVAKRRAVVIASVIDKRYLYPGTTPERLHTTAYEFLLERIQHYLKEHHPKHQALIVMDDTDRKLNQSVAMQHAAFQRYGNRNMAFPNIVEYPFFTRSELSNGVQLADQLAYNVYRAFRSEEMDYPYFNLLLDYFYSGRDSSVLHGLKVWPDSSPLVNLARDAWANAKKKALG